MNPLPPQAYTKEVLLKAYSWLQNQNPSIKEMASTPDVLVSLFLKTTRDGEDALERPSIQNFKKELKSIAEMMGEFDKELPESQNREARGPTESHSSSMPSLQNSQPKSIAQEPATLPVAMTALSNLDTRSQFMIQEVKELLNLSSDSEALRLLIKLGHQKAKTLTN
jgi:hypothetical protein